jgi:hypothetical protein
MRPNREEATVEHGSSAFSYQVLPANADLRAATANNHSNRAVITQTGLDTHRYICSVLLGAAELVAHRDGIDARASQYPAR